MGISLQLICHLFWQIFCFRCYQLYHWHGFYLQILLSVHCLQVVVSVCIDLQRFSMEQHLHCDEVCENPLPKKQSNDCATLMLYLLMDVCVQCLSVCQTDFDVLQLLSLEVCDGLFQLSDAALGIVGSLLSVDFCLSNNIN